MSGNDNESGTGKLKVTEGYLENFARNVINTFLKELWDNDDYRNLSGFADGPIGPGGHGKILAGGKSWAPAEALQKKYHGLCTSLKQQIDAFSKTMGDLSNDLLSVNQILDKGEQEAELTASEMMQDLTDILNGLSGGSPSTTKP
ncbi:hypothetical protein ACFVZR_32495 [Streptomyces sp. NPDC058316]|uniref:hypothetical protein n=1 Tax=unclassified Streptomyces TaxID=2593676 RepID=UPI003331C7A9